LKPRTTGVSRPVSGSTIVVRASALSLARSHTGTAVAYSPFSTCRTLIACMPPWLWPISIGGMPSRS
jgi:hypothetical protein